MTLEDFKDITLGDWLRYWFETYKKPYLSAYSVRNLEQVIRLHTPPWLKAKLLIDISIFDIDKALSEIPPSRTLSYTKQTWHAAFKKACQLGIIDKNILTFTDKVTYKKKRSNALTIEEQKAFIEALEGKRIKWLMLFYLYTGVRRAEALTLKWSDIFESQRLILIRGTKTDCSYRYILLTEDVKKILQGQREQSEREGDNSSDYVFHYSLAYVSRAFKALCPNHHLHELRHNYITRCAECGVNVNVCQQLVGHSTPNLTLSVYTHVMDDYKRKEALKFTLFPKI